MPISANLALDLRLRYLESLVASSTPAASGSSSSTPISIKRRTALIQSQLSSTVASTASLDVNTAASDATGISHTSNDSIRRFIHGYDLNEPLLRLQPITDAATSMHLSTMEKIALILEAENEIKSLERELREIELLDQRGVVGAGELDKHEALKPGLTELRLSLIPVAQGYSSRENRTNELLSQYNDYISTLSEIFISWNSIIGSAEEEVNKAERDRARAADIS